MTWIKSPCRGICTATSQGDEICRGCYRNDYDVIAWNGYSDQQKIEALTRSQENQRRLSRATIGEVGCNKQK